jgi:hypothetical protein
MPNTTLLSLLEGSAGAVFEAILTISATGPPRRLLTYQNEVIPIFRAQQPLAEGIQARYDDVLIENTLNLCRVAIVNSGSQAITDQPVLVQLKEGVHILEHSFDTRPEREFGEIVPDEGISDNWRRRYTVELMNPGDQLCVNLIAAGELTPSDITVAARGHGLVCLRKISYESRQRRRKAVLALVAVLLIAGFLVVLTAPPLGTSLSPFGAALLRLIQSLYRSFLPAVAVILVSLVVAHTRRPTARLSYSIARLKPVFTTAKSYRRRLSVEYKERHVESLHTCQILLHNTGNKMLEDQAVLVSLIGANVLNTDVRHEPELEFGSFTWDKLGSDKVKYYFSQLEPKDKVTIDVTFEGTIAREDVKVDARGEMLKVEPEQQTLKIASALKPLSVGIIAVSSLVLAAVVLLFVFPRGLSFDGLRELVDLVWNWFVGVSGEPGFFSGLFIGVVGFALVAFIVFRVNTWWRQLQQVTDDATRRGLTTTFVLGLSVFLCLISLLVEIIQPGILLRLLRALGLMI